MGGGGWQPVVVEVKPGWKAGTKVSYDIEVRDEKIRKALS